MENINKLLVFSVMTTLEKFSCKGRADWSDQLTPASYT